VQISCIDTIAKVGMTEFWSSICNIRFRDILIKQNVYKFLFLKSIHTADTAFQYVFSSLAML